MLKDNKIIGAVLYGDTADSAFYFEALREGKDVAHIRDRLVFGAAHLEDQNPAEAAKAA